MTGSAPFDTTCVQKYGFPAPIIMHMLTCNICREKRYSYTESAHVKRAEDGIKP